MYRWAVTQYTNTYLSECDALSYSLTKRQVVLVVRRWRWLWFIAQYVNVIDDNVLQSNQKSNYSQRESGGTVHSLEYK